MTAPSRDTRTVMVERELAHSPEKIWRALTTPHLIEAWLMHNDFAPVVGRPFHLRAAWGAIACEVVDIEPGRTLSYRWDAMGLESVVTWTLTPTPIGTRLRMEQTGFRPDQEQAYQGAKAGWPRFFANLETVAAGVD